jgi:hypothetical protein
MSQTQTNCVSTFSSSQRNGKRGRSERSHRTVTVDLLLESKVFDYDILPQMPIILGAGGVVSDWDGQPFGAASSYVTVRMAANADLQAATLERLRMS